MYTRISGINRIMLHLLNQSFTWMQRLFDYAMFTQHYENYENHTENDCPKLNIVFSLRLIRCCNTLILYTEAHLECAEKFGLVRGGGVCVHQVSIWLYRYFMKHKLRNYVYMKGWKLMLPTIKPPSCDVVSSKICLGAVKYLKYCYRIVIHWSTSER